MKQKGHGISLIVPFHCPKSSDQRAKNWRWLKSYWKHHLPGAEIIMGEDKVSKRKPSIPFSKSMAVNHGAKQAKGDVFVIIDADGYISAHSILLCAGRIRRARERDQKLWFVPYRQFYRLTKEASAKVLCSDPKDPYRFPTPPAACHTQNDSGSRYGHWWGAGIQICPREAFECVGGWDERFRGWGGEDHAAMQAMDTLYWRHQTLPGQHLHIWHPMLSDNNEEGAEDKSGWVGWKYRVWNNQKSSGANDKLSTRYYGAKGHVKRMRKLVKEWQTK